MSGDLVFPSDINQLVQEDQNGFSFLFHNAALDEEGHASGLTVQVIGPAESLDTAHREFRAVLASRLDLLSFVTHSRFKISKPLHIIEWEAGQTKREFLVFHTSDARYPPDPELSKEYLETVAALEDVKPPRFVRLALHYFRYGVRDEQLEDQFMSFFLALEIIAENMKDKSRVPIECPQCNAALKCDQCGIAATRVPMATQAIRKLICAIAGDPAGVVAKRLLQARNGLIHGRDRKSIESDCGASLDKIVNETAAVAWHAIMSSIGLGEGPPLAFGHRDGEFANQALTLVVRGSFEHDGDTPHPAEDRIPRPTIKLHTNFRQNVTDLGS